MKTTKVKFFTYKNIAMKLFHYFTVEKSLGRTCRSISNPFKRTKHLLDLSDRTLNRWILEENTVENVDVKKTGRPVKFDAFDRDLVGRTISKMLDDNQYVTLKTLKSYLSKNIEMDINKQTLWRIVRSLGFRFKKTKASKDTILR